MSEELEALEYLGDYEITYDETNNYTWTLSDTDQYKIVEKALKRNVPLEVNHKENKGVTTVGTCGNCGGLVSEVNDNYCSLCGQKTKWEETK